MPELDLTALAAERARLRAAYLRTGATRTPTTARGVHHVALLCANVERTIQFYQDLLEFPLTDVFENRDYKGSTHFSSTLVTATPLPSSTFRGWTWAPTRKCSEGCITWRSPWSQSSGNG